VVKTYNISEIDSIAKEVWQEGRHCKTWILDAPMGAGKTTLVHAICGVLQVNEAVSSPTFALINEYASPIAGTIFHMDWYRLKDEQEAIQAGMEDAILSDNFCFIEWPEKAAEILPGNLFRINIELVDEHTRRIHTSTGAFAKKD
jgi:tRNA threonylcarbamoyladenosine biosynthesis protein TsaE